MLHTKNSLKKVTKILDKMKKMLYICSIKIG